MLIETLRDFLAQAVGELEGTRSRFGRAVPLIGVPIFGSGLASDDFLLGSDQAGEILLAMLEELDVFTHAHAIDVALCTVDSASFSAAQTARRRLLGERRPDRFGRLWRLKLPPEKAIFIFVNGVLPSTGGDPIPLHCAHSSQLLFLCSCAHVTDVQGLQGSRWIPICDIQWRECVWRGRFLLRQLQ